MIESSLSVYIDNIVLTICLFCWLARFDGDCECVATVIVFMSADTHFLRTRVERLAPDARRGLRIINGSLRRRRLSRVSSRKTSHPMIRCAEFHARR